MKEIALFVLIICYIETQLGITIQENEVKVKVAEKNPFHVLQLNPLIRNSSGP